MGIHLKAAACPAIIIFVLCQTCTCRHEESSSKIEVVDGVKVIRNFKASPQKDFKTPQFAVDLSIGLEEGDPNYLFNYPIDIDSDADGNIYVLDYQDCVVKKYDPAGLFLKQFGRKGQGPGEFQTPYCMGIGDQKEIYVKDGNKIEIFSLEGEYQRTLAVSVPYFFSLIENRDFIVDQYTSDKEGNRYYSVGRLDVVTKEVKPFLTQRVYWPARITDEEFAYEFPYFVRWGVSSENRVYAASGIDYCIHVFDSEGTLLCKFTKDYQPVFVAGEEKEKIEAILKKLPARAEENPYRPKLVYPVFKYISLDESDRVWVERYQPAWRMRANKETIYDIFSPDGIFLFATRISGHIFPQVKFKNGYLYALKKKDSGYVTAVRLKMSD